MAKYIYFILLFFNANYIVLSNNYQQLYDSNIYNQKINRLSEILGSLQFLERLCNSKSAIWKNYLERLIEAQNASDEQKTQMISYYNHGYQSFRDNYEYCTTSATIARQKYLKNIELLSIELLEKYKTK
ncbi:TIGR02301 family protein [Bartonella sp. DGB1]|uniref:TIGR02301 family protein n=1 Tax=Bartonella sp. DGB1 TaxID=3239807 RepID=UPI00352523AC